jgi:hypothetical protein
MADPSGELDVSSRLRLDCRRYSFGAPVAPSQARQPRSARAHRREEASQNDACDGQTSTRSEHRPPLSRSLRLGNFVGYHILSDSGVLAESAILRVTLGNDGRVLAGRWISIHLDGGVPRPEPSNASAQLMTSLSNQDFPTDYSDVGPCGFFHP